MENGVTRSFQLSALWVPVFDDKLPPTFFVSLKENTHWHVLSPPNLNHDAQLETLQSSRIGPKIPSNRSITSLLNILVHPKKGGLMFACCIFRDLFLKCRHPVKNKHATFYMIYFSPQTLEGFTSAKALHRNLGGSWEAPPHCLCSLRWLFFFPSISLLSLN